MNEATLISIKNHASVEYPRESCGVISVVSGKERYTPCRNIAESNEQFVIHPEDYAKADDAGEILSIVHSHCNIPPAPSQADLVGCERSGLPWVIVSHPTGQVYTFEPSGYEAPLVGRQFSHGILDCYTLCRDYYKRTLDIDLIDFQRDYEWWLKGQNLYMDYFQAAGFVQIDLGDLREHDSVIMQVRSPVPNHAAVYIGDDRIIQHVMGRLSSRDVYGGWYRKCTILAVRHRSLL